MRNDRNAKREVWTFGGIAAAAALGVGAVAVGLSSALFAGSVLLNCGLAALVWNRHRAFARMREAERAFRDLYDHISEGVFRSTLDGRMLSANPSLVRLNGYRTEAEMLAGVNDIGSRWYVDPNRRAEIHALLLEHGRVSGVVSEIYRYKTRERIWVEENTRLVRDGRSGEPLYYDGTVREVTETIRRLQLQDRYDKITSIMSGCLFQFHLTPDGKASMPYASVGLARMFGVQPDDVRDDAAPVFQRIDPADIPRLNVAIEHSLATMTDFQCEYRVSVPGRKEKWIFGHSTPERLADGSTLWHGYLTDISERKSSEAKIYDLAYFDPLTGLPNRTMLREALKTAVGAGGRGGSWSALLFIDLDQFKMLNDTKGHHVGDMLLCEVAKVLRGQVRTGDLVARLGGDEFVVLLRELSGEAAAAARQAASRGEQILSALARPFVIGGSPFQTSASMGATLFCADGREADDLLKCADLAMYEAKAAGRNALRFFAPEMQQQIEDRLALTSDLREALSGERLALAYQPLVDRGGAWIGAETLLRWSHPVRGPVPPTEVIALAEREGLADQLEAWVLRSACATLRSWRDDASTRDLQLAVNVGARQLGGTDFVATLQAALEATGADPRRLTLELTEHVMLDDIEQVSAVMLRLKSFGVSFAIDDFGTGYSSLSYLKRLPIDALKIDRSFIRDLETDPSDRAIVQTIVTIARSLQVAVVAEGVETDMQALLLRQMGCDAYQGYLFGRPMPLDDFAAHLGAPAVKAGPAFDLPKLRASW